MPSPTCQSGQGGSLTGMWRETQPSGLITQHQVVSLLIEQEEEQCIRC